ncbi:RpiR family transcriptional regulator [Marinomonas ushuaiensis DSM 15871]|uniref:RpiR family transcriptional regulator n=1 Tax=Marinomonas ushuaiensis DSM 15871 TaxID=1122207 RepID=X7EB49_9GAMM|nr:MurR/RpiR family transcriptional regulator [Marinomonas ushuaiensis]ETX12401.1 RpiR family transcriptional regulator [Marinomonas ushuaiensis DSM 15871]
MTTKQDVLSLIEANYSKLSPSARSIANYLQQNPLAIVSQTSAEIADNTHTSKATVSRFFRQLGYETHQGAKQAQLALRESGVPTFIEGSSLDQTAQEMKNLSLTFEGLRPEILNDISQRLATASRVTLIGFRNAYPLALHFRQQLQQVRHSVRLLPQPGQTLGEDLHDILDDEVIVLLGFRRRTRQFKHIVQALKGRNTILITDPTGQVYNQQVSDVLVCHLGNESPFDSYAAPMSLISMLCNRTFGFLGDSASRQAQDISELYEALDELEP